MAGGESVSAGVAAGGGEPVRAWSRVRDSREFLQETWRRGEPAMRPDGSRMVLARTAGMAAFEEQFWGRTLFVTVVGEVRVTPTDLLAALELHCGVRQTAATVEVTSPPYHFFVRFDSDEDCTRVVDLSPEVRCGGASVSVRRWSRSARGTPGKLEYHTVLSIEGLSEEAQEPQAVNLVLAGLNGELIEMLPATDRWVVTITPWLRDPCSVPKRLTVTVPAPTMLPTQPNSDEDIESPPPPSSPTEKRTQEYNFLLHVKEVIDRGPLLMEGTFYPDEDEYLSRKHTFKTW